MINDLRKELKDEYINWVNQRFTLESNNDFIEIKTPFVDMHHDYISLFFSKEMTSFKLSDDGYIIDEISELDVNVTTSEKRKRFFYTTLKTFGVLYNKDTSELYVTFDKMSDYPIRQQRLIQCILRVSDMLLTSRNKEINFFTEDIAEYFMEKEVYFNEAVSFIGKSGRNQIYDFVLPRAKNTKPKLIKAINSPTSESYKDPLIAFIDIQETKIDHNFIVLANDTNVQISEKFKVSLENYEISVLPWSKRDDWVDSLKAF